MVYYIIIKGKACGLDLVDYPYLYFVLPYGDYFNRTVCVKECPAYTSEATKPTSLNCSANQLVTSCNAKCSVSTSIVTEVAAGSYNFLKDFVCIFNSTYCNLIK